MSKTTTANQHAVSPVDALIVALKTDPGYRHSWLANIAMAFKDEYARSHRTWTLDTREDIHLIANRAAENFLSLLCMDSVWVKDHLPEGTQASE